MQRVDRAANTRRLMSTYPSRGLRITAFLLAVVALTSGCTSQRPPAGYYLPSGPAIVNVEERDNDYILDQSEVPAGRVVFRIANKGRLAHDLSLVALPQEVPPIKEQLRSANRRGVKTLAYIPSHRPGDSEAVAVDLAPGRYALLCFEKDGTGQTHALMGMATEIKAVPHDAAPAARP